MNDFDDYPDDVFKIDNKDKTREQMSTNERLKWLERYTVYLSKFINNQIPLRSSRVVSLDKFIKSYGDNDG